MFTIQSLFSVVFLLVQLNSLGGLAKYVQFESRDKSNNMAVAKTLAIMFPKFQV
jgi:hypothetical protein